MEARLGTVELLPQGDRAARAPSAAAFASLRRLER
jgi:hypothetical protein